MSASVSRSRSPAVSDTARCTCPTSFDTRDSSWPAALRREEARRLPEDVSVELVAQVHHDPLPDVLHQVAGEIRPDALQEIQRRSSANAIVRSPSLVGQHLIEDRPDQIDDQRRRDGIDHHRQHRPGQAALVWLCVPKEPEERVHSVKRYFSSTHSATTPSRHVIFLPSS